MNVVIHPVVIVIAPKVLFMLSNLIYFYIEINILYYSPVILGLILPPCRVFSAYVELVAYAYFIFCPFWAIQEKLTKTNVDLELEQT